MLGVVMQMKALLKKLVLVGCSIVAFNAVAEAPLEIDGAKTVSLTEAKTLYEEGAVFIDVRGRSDWSLGHVEGAVHLDFNADEFAVLYLSEDLDRSTPIVFYTSSALNIRGAMASFFASNWGYSNVYYFRDGYYSWMAADYPVELKLAKRQRTVAVF